jgi:AcrR family transcriptional regulator
VFGHFGTKDRLVGAVLDHLATELAALAEIGAPRSEVERAIDRHTRVMARALLDGYPVGRLQSSFPNLAHLVDEIAPNFDEDLDARPAAANAVALQLGWRPFRPFLQTALELDDIDDSAVTDAVNALLRRE